ncbi:hypothetical protein RCL1_004982 [Eukaryota sp. TZLM3-RCL]
MRSVLLLVILSILFVSCHSISFTLLEGYKKVFAEELPPHTLVRVHYKAVEEVPGVAQSEQPSTHKAHIVVLDPSGRTVSTTVVKSEGQVVFTSSLGGIYEICFIADASMWFRSVVKLKFSVSIKVGHSAVNYADVAKREQLDYLQLTSRRLLDGMNEVIQVQKYLSDQESDVRVGSEATRRRVNRTAAFCVLIIMASSGVQMYFMRNYLKKRLKMA